MAPRQRNHLIRALAAGICAVLVGCGAVLDLAIEGFTGVRLNSGVVLAAIAAVVAVEPLQRNLQRWTDCHWPTRRPLTFLFTDIVGSTELLVQVGDEAWCSLLRAYRAAIRRELKHFDGMEVDTAGDGFFAVFDCPVHAVRCAQALQLAMLGLGLRVRIGLHHGCCATDLEQISGLHVHTAARVMAAAEPGEVLVSHAVRVALGATDVALAERGLHVLKGVPGRWPLYAMS